MLIWQGETYLAQARSFPKKSIEIWNSFSYDFQKKNSGFTNVLQACKQPVSASLYDLHTTSYYPSIRSNCIEILHRLVRINED